MSRAEEAPPRRPVRLLGAATRRVEHRDALDRRRIDPSSEEFAALPEEVQQKLLGWRKEEGVALQAARRAERSECRRLMLGFMALAFFPGLVILSLPWFAPFLFAAWGAFAGWRVARRESGRFGAVGGFALPLMVMTMAMRYSMGDFLSGGFSDGVMFMAWMAWTYGSGSAGIWLESKRSLRKGL